MASRFIERQSICCSGDNQQQDKVSTAFTCICQKSCASIISVCENYSLTISPRTEKYLPHHHHLQNLVFFLQRNSSRTIRQSTFEIQTFSQDGKLLTLAFVPVCSIDQLTQHCSRTEKSPPPPLQRPTRLKSPQTAPLRRVR